jgi:hypothetical protein
MHTTLEIKPEKLSKATSEIRFQNNPLVPSN